MPRRVARWVGRRLGRRGTILGAYGTVWMLIGYGQIMEPQPDQRGLTLLLGWLPLQAWGCLWIAAGLLAVVCAWLPQGRDWLGFLSLMAIVLPWMLSYLVSWWPMQVFSRGWVAAVVWSAITVPVGVVAGWAEPIRPKKVEHSNGRKR
jgi:hypothetical protein